MDQRPLIVVPDTHAHLREVEAVLNYCERQGLLSTHRLVFLGDYLDRGPDSRGLIDLCIDYQKKGHIFLMGNHEYVLLKVLDATFVNSWVMRWYLRYEENLLASYGVDKPIDNVFSSYSLSIIIDELREAMPSSHLDFLRSLPYYYETEDLICVHAGLKMTSWRKQKKELNGDNFSKDQIGPDQIFSRELALAKKHGAKKLVVSGHISGPRPTISHDKKHLCLHCGIDYGGPLVIWISDQNKYLQLKR